MLTHVMDYITVIARTPGGRDREETYSYDEFFALLVECAADKQVVAEAIDGGELKVHELVYLWENDPAFARWAGGRVDALPEADPTLPYAADRCRAVTFPFAQHPAESRAVPPSFEISSKDGSERALADFTQGVSFHQKDLEKPQLSVRGVGRGRLDRPLWDFLLALPSKANTRYAGFHLGNSVDQYDVAVSGGALAQLFERIGQSGYRSAKEMREYLLYHRPERIALTYSCTRE